MLAQPALAPNGTQASPASRQVDDYTLMTPLQARKLRYYLRLEFPRTIIWRDGIWYGHYADLSGCNASAPSPAALYHAMFEARLGWFAAKIIEDAELPLPNCESI